MLLNQPNVTCVMRVMSAMRADTSTNALKTIEEHRAVFN